jgi:protoporphyrinogen/coproporphyrinogen III oxidase
MKVAVVGSGIAGLAAALKLQKTGHAVDLFEASDSPGGVIRSERREGYLLEFGPNTSMPSAELVGLVEELGLRGEMLLADPRAARYVEWRGKLRPVPMGPGAFLTTDLMTLSGKLRLFAEPFIRARRDGEEESIASFARRRLGRQATERMLEPLIGGIYAGDAWKLSVRAAFPKLERWERENGSIVRGALASRKKAKESPVRAARPLRGLLSFRDGMQTLPRALAERLGGAVHLGEPVRELRPDGRAWRLSTGRREVGADAVVLGTPASNAASLVRPFAAGAAEALEAIPYASVAILHLGGPASSVARRLEGFGYLVAPAEGKTVLGCLWSSSLFPGRAPEGRVLLTLFLGGVRHPEIVRCTDAEIADRGLADIRLALGVRGPLEPISIHRYEGAIPQYVAGHGARMAALADAEAKLPTLRFVGNYRSGISVGDAARSGLELNLG